MWVIIDRELLVTNKLIETAYLGYLLRYAVAFGNTYECIKFTLQLINRQLIMLSILKSNYILIGKLIFVIVALEVLIQVSSTFCVISVILRRSESVRFRSCLSLPSSWKTCFELGNSLMDLNVYTDYIFGNAILVE